MPLDRERASQYRAIVARANYLSQDRSDIQYATKELSRAMANPTRGDEKRTKRLGRYLKGIPRVLVKYNYQEANKSVHVWVDTDYAGCRKTRKSISLNVSMLKNHLKN